MKFSSMQANHLKTAADWGALIGSLSVAAQVWTPIVGFITAVLSLGWIVLRWYHHFCRRP